MEINHPTLTLHFQGLLSELEEVAGAEGLQPAGGQGCLLQEVQEAGEESVLVSQADYQGVLRLEELEQGEAGDVAVCSGGTYRASLSSISLILFLSLISLCSYFT